MKKILTLVVLLSVLLLISCSGNVPTNKSLSQDNSEKASSNTEILSDKEPDSEKALPISITLTRESPMGIYSKTIFKDTTKIEKIVGLFLDCQPLPDDDKNILHRDGGTIITALFQMDSELSYTVNLILSSPESLGYEVLMLRSESEKYYTDVKVYDSLLEIIKNDSQTEYYE